MIQMQYLVSVTMTTGSPPRAMAAIDVFNDRLQAGGHRLRRWVAEHGHRH
jgi:hypothetical protein